jgi:hypothetical protein
MIGNFMKYFILILAVSLFAASCATYTPPVKKNIVNKMIFNKPYDEVWNKIIDYMSSHSLPIKNMEKASGLIVTESVSILNNDKCMDCGDISRGAQPYERKGDFNIFVQIIGSDSTQVTINTRYSAMLVYMGWDKGANNRIDCYSTGGWEKEIFDYIGR